MNKFSKEDQMKVKGKFDSIRRGNFSEQDANTVLKNSAAILSKSSNGPLGAFFDDVKTMCEMVKAWKTKQYTGIPVRTIGMIILTLAYVFWPADVIPDYIPVIGLADDATMVSFCVIAARSDINDFRVWALSHHKLLK